MRDGGKGDAPRPIENREQFENNWEKIFGNGKQLNRPKDDANATVEDCKDD
jgi:hypothetical protein